MYTFRSLQMRFVLPALFLAVAACGNMGGVRLSNSPEQTRESLLRRIPVGTQIQDATAILKKSHFQCEVGKSAEAWGKPDEPYIWCRRTKTIGVLTERAWLVALFYTNSVVSDIKVKVQIVTF